MGFDFDFYITTKSLLIAVPMRVSHEGGAARLSGIGLLNTLSSLVGPWPTVRRWAAGGASLRVHCGDGESAHSGDPWRLREKMQLRFWHRRRGFNKKECIFYYYFY